jgi:homoserine kinase
MEGHPDNVAPALLGGCQIVAMEDDEVVSVPVALAGGLRAVLFIPEQPAPTDRARSVQPPQLSREDAVFNLSRTAILVNALATGRYQHLRLATQDRLHQPQRQELFPATRLLVRAALAAGALGVFLSGAGPTVLALTAGREMTIGYEMAEMADKAGVAGVVRVVELSPLGAHVVSVE